MTDFWINDRVKINKIDKLGGLFSNRYGTITAKHDDIWFSIYTVMLDEPAHDGTVTVNIPAHYLEKIENNNNNDEVAFILYYFPSSSSISDTDLKNISMEIFNTKENREKRITYLKEKYSDKIAFCVDEKEILTINETESFDEFMTFIKTD